MVSFPPTLSISVFDHTKWRLFAQRQRYSHQLAAQAAETVKRLTRCIIAAAIMKARDEH
jgi:hypothetical protein